MKHRGGSIMLWGFFAAGGTGALHKIDGFMRSENDVDILNNISRHQSGSERLIANGSSKWRMTPSIPLKLWQNGIGIGVAITTP